MKFSFLIFSLLFLLMLNIFFLSSRQVIHSPALSLSAPIAKTGSPATTK